MFQPLTFRITIKLMELWAEVGMCLSEIEGVKYKTIYNCKIEASTSGHCSIYTVAIVPDFTRHKQPKHVVEYKLMHTENVLRIFRIIKQMSINP